LADDFGWRTREGELASLRNATTGLVDDTAEGIGHRVFGKFIAG
jgi:hypothetical protein